MTWEIAVGLFTIVSAFIAVMKVVVRINRTLTTLDISVNRLNESMKEQSQKNEKIFKVLEEHEKRIEKLEKSDKSGREPSDEGYGRRD